MNDDVNESSVLEALMLDWGHCGEWQVQELPSGQYAVTLDDETQNFEPRPLDSPFDFADLVVSEMVDFDLPPKPGGSL